MNRNCPLCGYTENSLMLREEEFKIVKCKKCFFVYLQNPPEAKEIYEEYFQVQYKPDDYNKDSKYSFLKDIHFINVKRVEEIKQHSKNGKILDVGCGTGLFLKTASEAGFEVTGTDISENALRFAREGFGLNVHNKSLAELIANNERYNIITLWHVLEHFSEPVTELQKVHSLLKDGGLCFIEVPNFNSLKFRLSGHKWKGGNHPLYHRSFFTNRTLKFVLSKSGFSEIKRIKISYLLPGYSKIYNISKMVFNEFAMDAFLNFVAKK